MSIEVIIKASHLKVSERSEEFFTRKVSKLDRFMPDLTEALVELAEYPTARSANDRYEAQITIRPKRGPMLRAEVRADDLRTAFDAAMDKLHRQIERAKGKRMQRWGVSPGGERLADVLTEADAPEALDDVLLDDLLTTEADEISRVKRFMLAPMTPEEALAQMRLLGHDNFFVFYNPDEGKVCVLYKRDDNTYGVIIPDVG